MGNIAKMYGQLPSYVRDHATTYDITVTETLLLWEKEQYDKAQGRLPTPDLSQEEMQAMINRVRNNKER